MFRQAEKRIQNWIDSGTKALLIHGARPIGKTWLIREMLQRNHFPYLEISLREREDIRHQVERTDSARELSMLLSLYAPGPLPPRKSVIFLDDIQVCSDILTKIRFLVDEGTYRYVLCGSNLGVHLTDIRSVPIGYVEPFQMYPMNLLEFSTALGIEVSAIDHIKGCYANRQPVDAEIHVRMIRSFYYYLMIGGMPAVVKTYLEQRNPVNADVRQKNILNLVRSDFARYEAMDRRLKIISVFDSIPSQLNKPNRRFTFTHLNKELKFDRYENSFQWLRDAAVAIPVHRAQKPRSPLEQAKSSHLFRLYLNDVGLLTACYPQSLRQMILDINPELQLNFGSLFENFVACELYQSGILPLYFKTPKIGEIDFLIELDGKVVPMVIRSGKDYRKHTALDRLLSEKMYPLDCAIVLSQSNLEQDGPILYLPIYMAGLIRSASPSDEPLDLSIFS